MTNKVGLMIWTVWSIVAMCAYRMTYFRANKTRFPDAKFKLHFWTSLKNTFSATSVKFSLVAHLRNGNMFKKTGLQLPFWTCSIKYTGNILLPRYLLPKDCLCWLYMCDTLVKKQTDRWRTVCVLWNIHANVFFSPSTGATAEPRHFRVLH